MCFLSICQLLEFIISTPWMFLLQENHALSIGLILMTWRQITPPNKRHYIKLKLTGSLKNVIQGMVFVPMTSLGTETPVLIPRCSERYFVNSLLKQNMLLWSILLQQDSPLVLLNIFLWCTCVVYTCVALLLMFVAFKHP